MNAAIEKLDGLCKNLRLDAMPAAEIQAKLTGGQTPLEAVITFLEYQYRYKLDQSAQLRIRNARFPRIKTFEEYDFNEQDGVAAEQMKQLCDFVWLEQAFNVMFLGAPGVGKTHLATALGYAAANAGYNVCFTTLEGLVRLLKTAEISKLSKTRLAQLRRASLVIIDEITCQLNPIDPTYTDEIHAIVTNCSNDSFYITEGDRIGQLVIMPCIIADFVTEPLEERGPNGFGSTGR